MIEIPDDFLDVLKCLQARKCEFAIVGAYALAFHGHPRATQDIDIWVQSDPQNAEKVFHALEEFGAPLAAHQVQASDFARPGNVYQIGLPPVRIDVLTSIDGVEFSDARDGFVLGTLGTETVPFVGINDQIVNKRSSGRVCSAPSCNGELLMSQRLDEPQHS